nr:uncharacterized protein LOC113808789 [Penaeus vannamei]
MKYIKGTMGLKVMRCYLLPQWTRRMAHLLIVVVMGVMASRCAAIFPFNLDAVDVVVTNVRDHLDETIDPYLVPAEHNTYGKSPYGYVPQKYVNEPICPLYIKPVWEEAVVQQVVHSLVTVWENLQKTTFVHVTETLKYPVTVINRSTVTIPAPPIYKTETIIVPEEKTVMSARIDTVAYTITQTNLEVITYTLTNTITTTTFEAEWITLTEYETSWETVNVPVTSITTIWTQEVG